MPNKIHFRVLFFPYIIFKENIKMPHQGHNRKPMENDEMWPGQTGISEAVVSSQSTPLEAALSPPQQENESWPHSQGQN